MRRLVRLVAAVLLLALPIALACGAREALRLYAEAVMPWRSTRGSVLVRVAPGARAADAVRALAEAGVLRNPGLALKLLVRSGQARGVKAGEYRFDRALSPLEVLQKLVRGDVLLRRITFPEGLTRFEMAARFGAAGLGSAAELLEATLARELVADLDPEAVDLEGYLFPETYHVETQDAARGLVRQMVDRFRSVVGPDPRQRAAGSGRTLRQVVTLASLVEKETARPAERPLVAGVYAERLRRGMLLQADPSVIYGLVIEGRYEGDLTRAHLREPGPYNTYARPGLPPGPIANPGKAALDAAFSPAPTDYLYFVSRNDGSHVFSRSLSEHNRGVERFQRQYFRELWRRTGGRRARSPAR